MTLDEARQHIGGPVAYKPPAGDPEQGVITSTSEHWVFVRYGSDGFSKATDPGCLVLLARSET